MAGHGHYGGRIRALTPTERLYLLDAARGYTAEQTARRQFRSINTVKTLLRNARAALGARTIAHAVALALTYGDITPVDLREDD